MRLLYKHYRGIDFFEGKPLFLLSDCLENAIKKETEIPRLIFECYNQLIGKKGFTNSFDNAFNSRKKMRTREEILKDYGLENIDN